LMLGITFKEDCPDIRNTRAIDIYEELRSYEVEVDVFDPWADPNEVKHEYGINIIKEPLGNYDGVVLAVAHKQFLEMNLRALMNTGGILYDVKGILPKDSVDARL
jgi:UDP-N-acetyl-D-galactosamine dehydrogenase